MSLGAFFLPVFHVYSYSTAGLTMPHFAVTALAHYNSIPVVMWLWRGRAYSCLHVYRGVYRLASAVYNRLRGYSCHTRTTLLCCHAVSVTGSRLSHDHVGSVATVDV